MKLTLRAIRLKIGLKQDKSLTKLSRLPRQDGIASQQTTDRARPTPEAPIQHQGLNPSSHPSTDGTANDKDLLYCPGYYASDHQIMNQPSFCSNMGSWLWPVGQGQ